MKRYLQLEDSDSSNTSDCVRLYSWYRQSYGHPSVPDLASLTDFTVTLLLASLFMVSESSLGYRARTVAFKATVSISSIYSSTVRVFGGDATDAYAHSPPPAVPTYVSIDDAYAEWYFAKFGVKLDRSLVLPVQHALQGHPESGRLWEELINKILKCPNLGFKNTVHDRTIYSTTFHGHKVLLIRQVDDFALGCTHEATAKAIYEIIGSMLQFPTEDKPPFGYLGEVTDYNGLSISQSKEYIALNCSQYINRVLTTHGWTKGPPNESPADHKTVPFHPDLLTSLYKDVGPDEGTAKHAALEDRCGFSFRSLLGELMYAYVTCRPDIGYHVTTLSKFSCNPALVHYQALKNVVRYLRKTMHWGIVFDRSSHDDTLPSSSFRKIPAPQEELPSFPAPESPLQLLCFVDAAHANDLRNRRSTTGYAFLLNGAVVSYRSKTQSITATSSTEAEFLGAVLAAKHAKYLRAILKELGYQQLKPTPIYEDNMSAINMINNRVPTERSRHIDIQHFAIQDWRDNQDIVMCHIPGTINPPDDLTKPLGWVLHSRHARRMMGHYIEDPTSTVPP